jgi:hypothetical protein
VHALYLILERIAPNPMVTLNRAVALAETDGPSAGLALLATLDGDDRLAAHHRLLSVRAHLMEKAGDTAGAYEHYRRAAKATASQAERNYLDSRASGLKRGSTPSRRLTPSDLSRRFADSRRRPCPGFRQRSWSRRTVWGAARDSNPEPAD